MASGILRSCLTGLRYCGACLVTILIWTVWLSLSLLLCFQAYIGTVNELQVPRFLLRYIEDHLALSGVTVTFGKAIFDPTGRLLLQKASFKLASFNEPVVTADAIYIRLDPIALLERRFEASEIRATGANLFIPGMLSASGRPEKIVQDLDAGFSITTRGDEFSVDYLDCRLGGIFVSAHGQINAGPVERKEEPRGRLPLTEFLAHNYVALSREFSRAEEQMVGLDHAAVTAELVPSDTRGAIVNAELIADGLTLSQPVVLDAESLHVSCHFPLLGGAPIMTAAVATAETLTVGRKVALTGLRARVRGILKIDTLTFDPRQLEITAGSAAFGDAEILAPIARVVPKDGHAISGEVSAILLGKPLTLRGEVDPTVKSAAFSFDGVLAPTVIDLLSKRIGADVRRFADLSQPVVTSGTAQFLPGWKFAGVQARVDTRAFTAYKVKFDEARGVVTFDGTHFLAREATAVSGDNLAQGSYEQNFSTKEFRYLLSGRLRPLSISPWFGGEWWTNIFKNFEFPAYAPDATIDVRGRYAHAAAFEVYGYCDSKRPIVRGVPFDRARVLIFVDPSVCDGLEINVAQGKGTGAGSFKLSSDPASGWTGLDLDARTQLDLGPLGKLLPADGAAAIAAFAFDQAPSVDFRGHFDGAGVAGIHHKQLRAEVRSDAGMRVHGVAFEKASFQLALNDDDIDISNLSAGFAGGTLTGTADVKGADDSRHLRFKAQLAGASLGQAAAAAQGYVTSGAAATSTALGTFAKDKTGVRLDLNASAEGQPGVLASFVGEGNVQVQGSDLGEISLFGGLSKVLKFPELRFTQARSSIKIEKASLDFSDLTIIGANSLIRAKGTYAIDYHLLNFVATIYPFMESHALLQIFNAISAPLSAVLRVRLSGTIDKPSWGLAYSPLNLLREGEAKSGAIDKSALPAPLATPLP